MKFTYPSGAKPLQGYTIKRGIGIGGFGEVYFALNDAGKEVALKKIQRNMDIELRGVRQCLNIRHVNLIALWDIRTSKSNESWVVMEYVPGPSLRDILDDHPRGIPESVLKLWFTSMASGVAYLHHRGIVHRDLKPGNVFRDDDAHVIKIGDYGLSKFISSNHQPGQTGTVGTVHYMAPEISKGIYGKEIDIYALGIILYELLTGDVPFNGETSQEIMYKHLLEEVNLDDVPSHYRDVLRGSLSKKPETRFSNVAEMMAAMPWPEFADTNDRVLSLHSVGVFPRPEESLVASAPAEPLHGQESTGARIEPILISNENSSARIPEIVIGPLSDYEPKPDIQVDIDQMRQLRKTTPPKSRTDDADLSGSEKQDSAPKKKLAKRTTVVGMEPVVLMDPTSLESALAEMPSGQHPTIPQPKQKGKLVRLSQRRRILAKKVARKCHAASSRFASHPFATPTRILIIALVAALIDVWPVLLGNIVVVLAVVYVSWYLMRTWAGASEIELEQRRLKKTGIQPTALRNWIQRQPASDRLIDGLASMLIAGLCCALLGLFGMGTLEPVADASLDGWAFYAWLAITSLFGSITVLCVSKYWESALIEFEIHRRFTLLGMGLATGSIAIVAASFFHVDLAFESLTDADLLDGSFLPLTKSTAWLVFFAALFLSFRWWRLTDPIRRSRLRLWNTGICLVTGAAIGSLLGLPLLPVSMLAFVIAIAIQLSAPFLSQRQRELISNKPQGTK